MDEYAAEENYSRKRPYMADHDDNESKGRQSKRKNSHNNGESVPLLKMLVPNYAAGAIIGKGGANIAEIQSRFGATIRLSPSGEFYPGTEERIVIITGEVNQIVDMNNYIIDKVHVDAHEGGGGGGSHRHQRDEERGQKVKIVVPNMTAGLVIGRGGATIKNMQEETKAKIMITGRDEAKVHGERIITISGNTEQRMEAARLVVVKIATDSENMSNKNLTYSGSANGLGNYGNMDSGIQGNLSALGSMLGSMQQHGHNNNQNLLAALSQNPLAALQQSGLGSQLGLGGNSSLGALGNLGSSQQMASLAGLTQNAGSVISSIKTTVTIQMEIPDILVGAILGKQGKTVHEFIQFSGAKIQFSSKNDFAPGTTDRILTIQGDLNQTQIAYFLINQKIMQAENELASGLQRR